MLFLETLAALSDNDLATAKVCVETARMVCVLRFPDDLAPEQFSGYVHALHLHAKYQPDGLAGDEPLATVLSERLEGEEWRWADTLLHRMFASQWPKTFDYVEQMAKVAAKHNLSWDPNDLAVSLTLWQRDDETREVVRGLWRARFHQAAPMKVMVPTWLAAWFADVEEEEMSHQAIFGPIESELVCDTITCVPYPVASRAGYRRALGR